MTSINHPKEEELKLNRSRKKYFKVQGVREAARRKMTKGGVNYETLHIDIFIAPSGLTLDWALGWVNFLFKFCGPFFCLVYSLVGLTLVCIDICDKNTQI